MRVGIIADDLTESRVTYHNQIGREQLARTQTIPIRRPFSLRPAPTLSQ